MQKIILCLILCLLSFAFVSAQEIEQRGYELALRRIEEARVSGAATLDLSRLELTELPPTIGNLSQLRMLLLNNNELRVLPTEIGNLSDLRTLHLHTNELIELPTSIGTLLQLEVLTLSNNQLTNLPSEIGNLTNLCYLALSHNELQYLPSTVGKLIELDESIDCFTYYATLPTAHLLLNGNPLISPPPEVIAQGTPAILEYLRNEAWWHLQRLILGGLSSVGLVVAFVLGMRWRQRQKWAKKRESIK